MTGIVLALVSALAFICMVLPGLLNDNKHLNL